MPSSKLPITQLVVVALCRFPQPFAIACLLTYIPPYLEYLSIPQPQISKWVGIMAASFGIFESCCALPFTMLSDRIGRKPVLLFALSIQLAGNLLLGFCTQAWHALICLICVGAANGCVAIMRICVAELVTKEQQSKAFAVLPTTAAVATMLAPIIGGQLSTLRVSQHLPFLLPSAMTAALFLPGIVSAAILLNETKQSKSGYQKLAANDDDHVDEENSTELERVEELSFNEQTKPMSPQSSWLQNRLKLALNCFLWLNCITGIHVISFENMIPVYLQQPAEIDGKGEHTFLRFSGGFGEGPEFTGTMLTMAGLVGILTAALLYPALAKRATHLQILRLAAICFPMVYSLFPFTSLIADSTFGIVACAGLILTKVGLAVLASQSVMILLTNSVPTELISNIHGVNFMLAGFCRSIGSISSGLVFSLGLKLGYIIIPFWVMAAWSIIAVFVAFCVAREQSQ